MHNRNLYSPLMRENKRGWVVLGIDVPNASTDVEADLAGRRLADQHGGQIPRTVLGVPFCRMSTL